MRVHALSTTVLSVMGIVGREGYPFTCATNLSPRGAELIRIRMPDTYLNARAYINLFKACVREGGRNGSGVIKGVDEQRNPELTRERKGEIFSLW